MISRPLLVASDYAWHGLPMVGVGGSVDDRTVAEVAVSMRALLAALDEGRIEATRTQRAYLAGVADMLDQLAGPRLPS